MIKTPGSLNIPERVFSGLSSRRPEAPCAARQRGRPRHCFIGALTPYLAPLCCLECRSKDLRKVFIIVGGFTGATRSVCYTVVEDLCYYPPSGLSPLQWLAYRH